MTRRMTIILHRTNQKLPFPVGILNYQFSLNSSLTATRYREYSKPLSTHSVKEKCTQLHFLGLHYDWSIN